MSYGHYDGYISCRMRVIMHNTNTPVIQQKRKVCTWNLTYGGVCTHHGEVQYELFRPECGLEHFGSMSLSCAEPCILTFRRLCGSLKTQKSDIKYLKNHLQFEHEILGLFQVFIDGHIPIVLNYFIKPLFSNLQVILNYTQRTVWVV